MQDPSEAPRPQYGQNVWLHAKNERIAELERIMDRQSVTSFHVSAIPAGLENFLIAAREYALLLREVGRE